MLRPEQAPFGGRLVKRLALLAFVLLAACAVYGLFHERLFAQTLWTPDGRTRFLAFSGVYWVFAAGFLFFAPRWLGPTAAIVALIYTIWFAGPLAPLAALYFFGSCFCLGRVLRRDADVPTSVLLGLAGWMFVIWIALHFPLNHRAAYAVALAIPYMLAARNWGHHKNTLRKRFAPGLGFALTVYFLMAYWLVELTPEISADALSMHLALPMAVAHDHRWAFDFRQYTWALIPSSGDCVFTAAYLLGGETAARLINLGLLTLIVAMVYRASRRWLPAALFASTPLVLLVTGSLFVENVWAAMILGGVLALIRYDKSGNPREIVTGGALLGAALAVKVLAAVFVAPAGLFGVWIALKRKQLFTLASAALLFTVLAIPPYAYAWVISGNPVFPFANGLFRSPYYPAESFSDPRFTAPISWRTFYNATFRSDRYFEGQAGGSGFQYFLLLIPAAILARRREAIISIAVGATGTILLFALAPYLRYMYPALPLFSIAIGDLLTQWRFASVILGAVAAINAWFLAAAGWYQKDFALFRHSQVAAYLSDAAPERVLISRLNREAPGEPVAFFSTDASAGLQAEAFTDSWHTNDYWREIRNARTAAEVADVLQRLRIHHIVAPVSLESSFLLFETFLLEWAEPTGFKVGRMELFGLRAAPSALVPLSAGTYDDFDPRIEYTGAWIHDRQFTQAANVSLSYCNVSGASLRFTFVGTGITYVFTKAVNRGSAQILIDGTERARIDMYSRETMWRSERTFEGLPAGEHVFEVRVLGEKNPQSSGTYVDLDNIVVDSKP